MSFAALKTVLTSIVSPKKEDKRKQKNSLLAQSSNATVSAYGSVESSNSSTLTDDVEAQSIDSSSSNLDILGKSFSVDPRVMSDVIIGLSDGLTVPFALTAGLSGLGDTKLVITGGLAELVSGAISMGLGGFLAAKSESEYYVSQVASERANFKKDPEALDLEVMDILSSYDISEQTIGSFVSDLEKSPASMIDFIIRFGKGLEEPAEGRQFTSALTIGLSYFFGGFVPLLPYFFTDLVHTGLLISLLVMVVTLFIFGYIKTVVSIGPESSTSSRVYSGFQMVLVGGAAAGAAWGLVKLIE